MTNETTDERLAEEKALLLTWREVRLELCERYAARGDVAARFVLSDPQSRYVFFDRPGLR